MGVSPVSNVRATYGAVGTAPTTHPHQPIKSAKRTEPGDSVHLSATARAHLHGDADGYGDSK